MFPNFIIIGAMKCGTSSLYHYLRLHPQVGMSEIKEVDFFVKENNYEHGVGWYQSQFKGEFDVYGEASPNYSKAHYFKGVARRMYDLLPEVKLIYLVRDPIERIISHYTHNYSEGREHQSIEKVLQSPEENHYVMCSKYFWQLEHYLQFFSKDQILVVPSFQLMEERRAALHDIFEFIGVEPSFYTPEFGEQKHKSSQKRRKGRLSRLVLESPIIKTLKGYVPDRVKDPIKKTTRSEVHKPELSASLQQRLVDSLRTDIDRLRSFTGLQFRRWEI